MLIQCHSCNTKYRLNLEQIPRRKTFVRCKNCGTPIYIDPTEETAPVGGVIPPPPGTVPPGTMPPEQRTQEAQGEPWEAHAPPAAHEHGAEGLVQVVCPGCSSRYRISAASVRRPGVKLKCTQCGHLFAPPAQPGAAPAQPVPPQRPQAGAPAAPGGEMPLPDEQSMDHMFDDLRPEPVEQRIHVAPPAGPSDAELGSLDDSGFDEEPPAPDAERAYLDAVSLDEEGQAPPAAGTVPDAQKYRYFLNPKDYHGSEPGMADNPEDTPQGMPPLPEDAASEAEFGAGAVPPLHEGADELPPLPSTEVAQSREDMAKIREVVPGQQARVFTEKRVLTVVAAAALVILVATGAWGYWLASTSGDRRAFSVRLGQPHQLAMEDDLQGRYVTNAASGERLFVVNGELENRFPPGTQLRWIRIKGIAYDSPQQRETLATTFAYAGNVLDDDKLRQWELPAIKAYYGFTNGRQDVNVSIAPGARVPYQLVFTEVKGQVGRTVAQIVSYHRDGQAVFIDNP